MIGNESIAELLKISLEVKTTVAALTQGLVLMNETMGVFNRRLEALEESVDANLYTEAEGVPDLSELSAAVQRNTEAMRKLAESVGAG